LIGDPGGELTEIRVVNLIGDAGVDLTAIRGVIDRDPGL